MCAFENEIYMCKCLYRHKHFNNLNNIYIPKASLKTNKYTKIKKSTEGLGTIVQIKQQPFSYLQLNWINIITEGLLNFIKTLWGWVVLFLTYNTSSLGGRGTQISEFEANLVYRVSSRTAMTIQRNPVPRKPNPKNQTKTKTKQ